MIGSSPFRRFRHLGPLKVKEIQEVWEIWDILWEVKENCKVHKVKGCHLGDTFEFGGPTTTRSSIGSQRQQAKKSQKIKHCHENNYGEVFNLQCSKITINICDPYCSCSVQHSKQQLWQSIWRSEIGGSFQNLRYKKNL